jgi:hypothetical protein
MRDEDDGSAFADSFSLASSFFCCAGREEEPALAVTCHPETQHTLLNGLCPSTTRFGENQTKVVRLKHLCEFVTRLKSLFEDSEESFCWIHVLGGEGVVSYIGSHLDLHPVARRLFTDKSPQSVVNQLNMFSFVAAAISIFLDGSTLRSQKITIYSKASFVLSMERELLVSPSASGVRSSRRIFDAAVLNLSGLLTVDNNLTAGFVVYLILMELTRMMGVISYIYAKSIANLQQSVEMRRVRHETKIKITRDLHNLQVADRVSQRAQFRLTTSLYFVQAGLVIIKGYFSNSTANRLLKLVSETGPIMEAHRPYLRDMDESVKCIRATVASHLCFIIILN